MSKKPSTYNGKFFIQLNFLSPFSVVVNYLLVGGVGSQI